MEQLEESSMVRHLPIHNNIEKNQDLSVEKREKQVLTSNDHENTDTQLSIFPEESLILDELFDLNLNKMTPLQALNYLHELTERLKK
jgi:DNA mismatch repair ATPase MutS